MLASIAGARRVFIYQEIDLAEGAVLRLRGALHADLRALKDLHATLKSGGVLFSSNPRGLGEEGWARDRFAVFHDWDTWRDYMNAAGFVELTHYYRPAGLPREQQPWLASVWRKPR